MIALRKQKAIILLISILYLPLLIKVLLSKKKDLIQQDVEMMNSHAHIGFGFLMSLAYHIKFNCYYRNVLYKRLGGCRFLSLLYPRERSFFPCTNIGGGVYLAHPYSTILNAKSIGSHFSCRQCTTIGNKNDGDGDETCPCIGENVTVGANVCIIGNIIIGDNVIIGAGSVVVKDVPSNVVVAGNPARIIRYL